MFGVFIMVRHLYLVGYDVGDDDRQDTIRNQVKNYAFGGQLSAYECYLTNQDKTQLQKQLNKPCELLKAGRSRFYQAFTAIRPSLEKQATAHIWAWLHRLEGQCIITGEEAILNASLDYMNDF